MRHEELQRCAETHLENLQWTDTIENMLIGWVRELWQLWAWGTAKHRRAPQAQLCSERHQDPWAPLPSEPQGNWHLSLHLGGKTHPQNNHWLAWKCLQQTCQVQTPSQGLEMYFSAWSCSERWEGPEALELPGSCSRTIHPGYNTSSLFLLMLSSLYINTFLSKIAKLILQRDDCIANHC